MTDTAIVERDVIVPAATDASRTPFSWSAAIAGAFGTAVELAKIVFFVALVLFVVAAIFGAIGGRRPVA